MANSQPERALAEPGLKMFIYFSQLLGRTVLSAEGRSGQALSLRRS